MMMIQSCDPVSQYQDSKAALNFSMFMKMLFFSLTLIKLCYTAQFILNKDLSLLMFSIMIKDWFLGKTKWIPYLIEYEYCRAHFANEAV